MTMQFPIPEYGVNSNSQNVKYYGIVKNILKFSEGFIIIYNVLKTDCFFRVSGLLFPAEEC